MVPQFHEYMSDAESAEEKDGGGVRREFDIFFKGNYHNVGPISGHIRPLLDPASTDPIGTRKVSMLSSCLMYLDALH